MVEFDTVNKITWRHFVKIPIVYSRNIKKKEHCSKKVKQNERELLIIGNEGIRCII